MTEAESGAGDPALEPTAGPSTESDRPEGDRPESDSSAAPPSETRSSGDTAIGRALSDLDRLPELDLAAHADVYQQIHGELQRALAAIDDA